MATRGVAHNGLGLARQDAVADVRVLRGRLRFMAENEKVNEQLLLLLDATECAGKQVHNANVVATMLAHGIDTVVTMNVGDFHRFEATIKVLSP